MFCGIHVINLDAKGRMSVPSRYRTRLQEDVSGHVVLTIDTEERCLLLYPRSIWKSIETKIEALPSFNKATRRIQRLLIGHATELELDGNGRILLPPLLRDYASLDKRIVLIGQGKKFEIWAEDQWNDSREAWLKEGLQSDAEIPEQLQDLSL